MENPGKISTKSSKDSIRPASFLSPEQRIAAAGETVSHYCLTLGVATMPVQVLFSMKPQQARDQHTSGFRNGRQCQDHLDVIGKSVACDSRVRTGVHCACRDAHHKTEEENEPD